MTALLTAREVAELLGVSTETTLRWVRRRELPALKLPSGAIRFRGTDLERWLAGCQLQNESDPAGEPGLTKTAGAGGGRARE